MVYPAIRMPALKTPATATVIFLHGLGDSGSGWSFLAEEAMKQKKLQHVNFVFPDAPMKAVTLNFGMKMPAWYDIKRLEDVRSSQDEVGVLEGVEILKQLIADENDKGIPANRVVIGGFSQGCALSLATSVTLDKKLAGILGLSGYLPIIDKLVSIQREVNLKTPVFLGHGTNDNVVKFEFGQMSRDALQNNFNYRNVEWHQYEGLVHSVSPEELNDIFEFLERVLPSQ
jgi:predicted esterase